LAAAVVSSGNLSDKSGARVDLALTLPVFLAYHLGVVFLNVKNGVDPVTGPLLELTDGNRGAYLGLTLAIGALFAGVFALAGRGEAFRVGKFVQIALEGVVYAVAMRFLANYVVGNLPIALAPGKGGPMANPPALTGIVMSMGAGFYEELSFRVLLFGLGAKALVWLFGHQEMGVVERGARLSFKSVVLMVGWALAAAAVFSGVHYMGALGDKVTLTSFVFRWVLGLALTLIFVTRGFAAAVWAHALYDVWVMVL
jgi:Type II CAAX prenyl endopeptidase Rce1-like